MEDWGPLSAPTDRVSGTGVLSSAPRTAIVPGSPARVSRYRLFSAKITTGQSSPPSQFPWQQRPGNPRKLVQGNFFSADVCHRTWDKPRNKYCVLNWRPAPARSHQPSHSLHSRLPAEDSNLAPRPGAAPGQPPPHRRCRRRAASDRRRPLPPAAPPDAPGLHSPGPTRTSAGRSPACVPRLGLRAGLGVATPPSWRTHSARWHHCGV